MNTSISGIYQIHNTINEKCYIGSAINIERRWRNHKSHLNNGTHANRYLQNAWNKYGADCFEFTIIEHCFFFALIFREQHYIDTLKPEYNLSPTAGSNLGVKHTAETRAKVTASLMGRKHSQETCSKISDAHKGVTPTLETRLKLSEAAKNRTPEHKEKLYATRKGRVLSSEQKNKLSIANAGANNSFFGKKHSEEARKKMSEAMRGKTPWNKGKKGEE